MSVIAKSDMYWYFFRSLTLKCQCSTIWDFVPLGSWYYLSSWNWFQIKTEEKWPKVASWKTPQILFWIFSVSKPLHIKTMQRVLNHRMKKDFLFWKINSISACFLKVPWRQSDLFIFTMKNSAKLAPNHDEIQIMEGYEIHDNVP